MMGSKERHFAPFSNVSLEELVPSDHFYRHLEQSLDLSFVRGFVQQTYAGGGRPSIDPIVFFKLQLVMFFEGIRAEAKDWHGLRRFRLRLLWRVNCEALRFATGQNLKRLLKKQGWGRRPFPVEALSSFFLASYW